MRSETMLVLIRILNAEYNIRCPSHKLESLLTASKYLDEKMRKIRDEGEVMSIDRIAIITALNIVGEHLDTNEQLAHQKQLNVKFSEKFQKRIQKIQQRIEEVLMHETRETS